MKRLQTGVGICIAIIYTLCINSSVNAQTPTPFIIDVKQYNREQDYSYSVGRPEDPIVSGTPIPNPNPQTNLSFGGEYNITAPKKPNLTMLQRLTTAARGLSPQYVISRFLPIDKLIPKLYQGRAIECISNSAGVVYEPRITEGYYDTTPLPEFGDLYEQTRLGAAGVLLGAGYSFMPNNDGKFDNRHQGDQYIDHPPCGANGAGTGEIPPDTIDDSRYIRLSLLERVINWLEDTYRNLTSVQISDKIHTANLLNGAAEIAQWTHGQGENDPRNPFYSDTSDDEKERINNTKKGGIGGSHKPQWITIPVKDGQQLNETNRKPIFTNTYQTYSDKVTSRVIACAVLPQHEIPIRVEAWDDIPDGGVPAAANGSPTPTLGPCQFKRSSCGPIPDLTGSACQLQNTDQIGSIGQAAAVPEGIPPTMKGILEKAAETFNIPPSSLLAVMWHEGGLATQYLDGNTWTEENVQKWSYCGETMPFCDPNDSAALPFGMQPATFNEMQTAVLEFDPSRAGQINICNFLDQAFAAAKRLSIAANYGLSTQVTQFPDCFGIPIADLASATGGSSCASPPWNDLSVMKSHIMYAGYCPEPGKGSPFGYAENANYRTWTLQWYNTFK